MKINELSVPGKTAYTAPVLREYVLAVSRVLCASDKSGSTEVWDEIDLSSL